MSTKLCPIAVGILAGLLVAGCSVGMQPEGPNLQEVQKIENHLPPEKQIQMIQSSPMPAAEKQKRIADIQAKYHLNPGSGGPAPGRPY